MDLNRAMIDHYVETGHSPVERCSLEEFHERLERADGRLERSDGRASLDADEPTPVVGRLERRSDRRREK
ncbi:hypothetical protein ACFQGT_02420 [Natrialbaceae archaeon GCM10025810]|uniref:hypothetical protein n=1 Tax=Halovalidus salilacus TaxID=3075124 RepID=UPI00361A429E